MLALLLDYYVADNDEVERLFGRIKEERGRLDILVNNAAIARDHASHQRYLSATVL